MTVAQENHPGLAITARGGEFITALVGPPSARARVRFMSGCPPTIHEANLLFVLFEARGQLISWDDVCYRLKATSNAVRIRATRVRKKLAPEWIIDIVNNKGIRIVKAGALFADGRVRERLGS